MIRPKDMQFVRMIGPNSMLERVIGTLYDLRLLHLLDFKKSDRDFMDTGRPLENAPVYSEQLVKVRSMISYFGLSGKPEQLEKFGQARRRFSSVEKRFRKLAAETERLESEEAMLAELTGHPMAVLGLKAKALTGARSVKVFLGRGRNPVKGVIESALKDCQLLENERDGEFYTALVVKNSEAEEAQKVLRSAGVMEYPVVEGVDFPKIGEKLAKVRKRMAAMEKAFDVLKRKHGDFLLDYELTVSVLSEKAEVPLRFASTRNAFVASGWVPKSELGALRSAVSSAAKGKIELETPDSGLEPPIALENPKSIRPFEFFLNLYSLPRYHEVDPTFILAVTFPLFFGFMLGDVGYGLAILALSLVLGKKLPAFKLFTPIIFFASLSSMAFGLVFGEFFGFEFMRPMLNRMHDVNTMLMLTVAIGFVHITLGFVLGFFNELRHGFLHALMAKGGWLVLEAGGILILYGYLNHIPSFQTYGTVIVAVSLAMLFKGEGIKSIVELPSIFSNMLSYARLYAIGLSSVSLAAVINEGSLGLVRGGGINLLLAIFILFMGHFVNLLLGVLGPFLQGTRLHYVEFFTKFFEGGGKEYKPFGMNERR